MFKILPMVVITLLLGCTAPYDQECCLRLRGLTQFQRSYAIRTNKLVKFKRVNPREIRHFCRATPPLQVCAVVELAEHYAPDGLPRPLGTLSNGFYNKVWSLRCGYKTLRAKTPYTLKCPSVQPIIVD